MTAAVY